MRNSCRMRIHYFNKPGYNVIFMVAEFVMLLCSLIYLDYIYLVNVRPDQLAAVNFVQTECFIMSKKLSTKGKILRRYRADFLINYQAKGAQYTLWVSGNGLDKSYSRGSDSQEKILAEFKDGSNHPCWYNPDNPEKAYLLERSYWSYFTPFLWPVMIMLVMLALFIKHAWRTFRLTRKTKINI